MYNLKPLFWPKAAARRGGRVVEGTRLLIWRTGNGTEGSNPSLSAKTLVNQNTFWTTSADRASLASDPAGLCRHHLGSSRRKSAPKRRNVATAPPRRSTPTRGVGPVGDDAQPRRHLAPRRRLRSQVSTSQRCVAGGRACRRRQRADEELSRICSVFCRYPGAGSSSRFRSSLRRRYGRMENLN